MIDYNNHKTNNHKRKQAYGKCSAKIEEWRMKPTKDEYPYIFLDGVNSNAVGAVKYKMSLSLWRSELIQKDTGKFSELLKEAVKIRSPGATFCAI